MALEVYIEENFDREHEANQAADFIKRLKAVISRDEEYKLLLNFSLAAKQIDALLITPYGFVVIDFKMLKSALVDVSEEDVWRCFDGHEMRGNEHINPFKQVSNYRRHLGTFVNNHYKEIFIRDRKNEISKHTLDVMKFIKGAICLGPENNNEVEQQVLKKSHFQPWFFVARPTKFVEKCVSFSKDKTIFLTFIEQRNFIQKLRALKPAVFDLNGIPQRPTPGLSSGNYNECAHVELLNDSVEKNTETQSLLEKFKESYKNGTKCFMIIGAAGTGKTTFVKALLPILIDLQVTPVLMTPTGRAAKVLEQRTGYPARTIHSTIFKINDTPKLDEDGDARKFIFPLDVATPTTSAYIIDEASMVALKEQNNETLQFGTGSLLKDLIKYSGVGCSECKNIIIFVGDKYQLSPVGESDNKTPPALDVEQLTNMLGTPPCVLELEEPHRQIGNSGILKEAARILTGLKNNVFGSFKHTEHKDVIKKTEDCLFIDYHPERDFNEKIVIAYTNASVWKYNCRIRDILRYTAPIVKGERLLSLRNTRALDENTEIYFMNGDFLQVEELSDVPQHKITGFYKSLKGELFGCDFIFRKMTVSWVYEPGRSPVSLWVNVTPILSEKYRDNTEYASIALYNGIKKEIEKNLQVRSLHGEARKQEIRELMQENEYLRAPIVTYGYAITGHKSQGGEWDTVWVDYRYSQKRETMSYFRWAYTVTTRAKKKLYAIEPPVYDKLIECLANCHCDTIEEIPTESISLASIFKPYGYGIGRIDQLSYVFRVFLVAIDRATHNGKQYIDINFKGNSTMSSFKISFDVPGALQEDIKNIIVGKSTKLVEEFKVDSSKPRQVNPEIVSISNAHKSAIDRMLHAIPDAGYTLTSAISQTEYSLRFTLDYGSNTGYFDLYFDGKGQVSSVEKHTIPAIVLCKIAESLKSLENNLSEEV